MKGIKVMQRLFRQRLHEETTAFLESLGDATKKRQEEIARALVDLNRNHRESISFGTTPWQQEIALPVEIACSHSLCLGASGAGKSYLALSCLLQLLGHASAQQTPSFGILDAKGELFEKALQYLYAYLYRLPSDARQKLQQKIVVIDFSNPAQITPYHLLARQTDLADEIMVSNRIEMISEQFAGLAELSVRMKMVLKYLFLLMAEFNLTLPFFEKLCSDPILLGSLVEKSNNPQVKDYFLYRFEDESKVTLLALRQRIDALLVSEGVRLSLAAPSAPDFTQLQDQGFIILINTAGRNITRGISELLQGLILSDIKQSVFRRANPQQKFLWFFDEAQNLYKTAVNRESMIDLLTMSRSFGSFFALLTQSLTSAVRDQDILNSILANVRWIVMLRSTLRDAALLSPALPLTGTLCKSQVNPFEPPKPLSESEELKARLHEITKLPDRQAYCWIKAHLPTAVKIMTPTVPRPHELAGCSEAELARFIAAEPIGQGLSKAAILQQIEAQQKQLKALLQTGPKAAPTRTDKKEAKAKRRSRLKALEDEFFA